MRDLDSNQSTQTGFKAVRRFERLLELLLHLIASALIEVEHDGVFRGVVVIRRSRGHLRLFSDAAHRRLVEPLLAKEFESGFKNSAAGCLCLSLRLLRCRSFEHVQLHSWPKDES